MAVQVKVAEHQCDGKPDGLEVAVRLREGWRFEEGDGSRLAWPVSHCPWCGEALPARDKFSLSII